MLSLIVIRATKRENFYTGNKHSVFAQLLSHNQDRNSMSQTSGVLRK